MGVKGRRNRDTTMGNPGDSRFCFFYISGRFRAVEMGRRIHDDIPNVAAALGTADSVHSGDRPAEADFSPDPDFQWLAPGE